MTTLSNKPGGTKAARIVYWISTGILALFILPGIFFLMKPFALSGSGVLGIPLWLHVEAGIGAFLGGLLLIVPNLPSRWKEWAYVGLGITYISAFVGHLNKTPGDVGDISMAVVLFALLLVSYISWHRTYYRPFG